MPMAWVQTHTGKVRSSNEDAFWFGGGEGWYLALVADGMGGHQAGDVASQLTADVIRKAVTTQINNAAVAKWTKQQILKEALQNANDRVFSQAQSNRSLAGMGTTVTALLLDGGAEIAHVGDSRAYLFRQGKLRQLTKDHSLVQGLVDVGSISRKQARYHPKRHLLTRVLGAASNLTIDRVCVQIEPGDLFLLCTDGLTGEITDKEIETVLKSFSPAAAVEELVKLALDLGGHDNITVLLVQAGDRL